MTPDSRTALVLFSAGTESTALLLDTINKFGAPNVIALTTLIADSPSNLYRSLYEPTEFYTDKICKLLQVTHIVARKTRLGTGQIPGFSSLQFIADAYNLVLATPSISHVFSGVSDQDLGRTLEEVAQVPHLALARKLFLSVMEAYDRDVKYEYPLSLVSKADQFNSIPAHIKPYVWTCYEYSQKTEDGYIPCGACFKCAEFKTLVTDKNHVDS